MNISKFIKEIRSEAKHINWPAKKTTTIYTVSVIVVSLLVGYYLGLFDAVFSFLLNSLI